MKKQKIYVQGAEVSIFTIQKRDYISLTDMVRNIENGLVLIEKWLRNKNTIEFLGVWEQLNNKSFNSPEFGGIYNSAGLNRFTMSVKQWISKTQAIGLISKTGRSGGTYAHKDIAFEFVSWLNPVFKLYLIKEFQRLKEEESERLALDWDIKRNLARVNYRIHTDAIKEYLIPQKLQPSSCVYANEADVLNKALFGMTAKEWRETNPKQEGNIRDYATAAQLVCLVNLESLNAEFIRQGLSQSDRLLRLNEIAIIQMRSLLTIGGIQKLAE
ncbi:MAG: DNA-binding protein [Candidatus Abawacabacteria bacterium RBG_16_42_10]|uniref:DNA-binding protein n=1 Tax=Candidatus Abawacabacteria bacterium RBG_16_42_10 TaxID=1817814 RepID=A0A1F4XMV4_9BACT|nr:MAG: DNA-binding protein [Candidatus Abawacabacteria bacterium RBG_16_42_10]